MDWIRSAISNAISENLTLKDLAECARNAQTPQSFDDAVNTLARLTNG